MSKEQAIKEITGLDTKFSTGGGTSDGRFIAPTGAEVVELGPINASVHQINEHVKIEDLGTLTQIYQSVLEKLLK
jgi:succinyl-diaminopimelate desuccinylase